MDEPPTGKPALVRTNQVAQDSAVVADWICSRRHVAKVALFAWATGGQWLDITPVCFHKGGGADTTKQLVRWEFRAPAYGSWIGNGRPATSGRIQPAGVRKLSAEHRIVTLGYLGSQHSDGGQKHVARSGRGEGLCGCSLEERSDQRTTSSPELSLPCGAIEDSFCLATGRQLWDVSLITAPTLVLASERDFWSGVEDRELLKKPLVHALRVKVVVIKEATHFVHLDRPEHGRRELIEEVMAWVE
jgi:pimeloyl-ACP methyl ester carboxylesterase